MGRTGSARDRERLIMQPAGDLLPPADRGTSAGQEPTYPERLDSAFSPYLACGTWPCAVDQHLEIALAPTAASPAHARQAVQGLLAGHVGAGELHETLILLSEVVMNAVRHGAPHGDGRVEIHVAVAPERIRAEVYDAGPGFDPGALSGEPSVAGGWGLVIVDRAASRWGASPGRRHCVWFELDRGAALPRSLRRP